MVLKKGDQYSYKRRISKDDILQFAQISGDNGEHHTNQENKLMAHGLLIATLPTKIGGDLNFIARQMNFEFLRAVYEGDEITCVGQVEKIFEREKRYKVEMSFRCLNETGEVVMRGTSKGMIWKRERE